MVWDRQCLEDSEQKDHLPIESINDKGVYRTAPATPDLVNYRTVANIINIVKHMGEYIELKDRSINYSIMRLFIEQPRLHRVC